MTYTLVVVTGGGVLCSMTSSRVAGEVDWQRLGRWSAQYWHQRVAGMAGILLLVLPAAGTLMMAIRSSHDRQPRGWAAPGWSWLLLRPCCLARWPGQRVMLCVQTCCVCRHVVCADMLCVQTCCVCRHVVCADMPPSCASCGRLAGWGGVGWGRGGGRHGGAPVLLV
jgi:hypothetical protein